MLSEFLFLKIFNISIAFLGALQKKDHPQLCYYILLDMS